MNKKLQIFYMKGKYGKRFREVIDRDNEYLYSKGRYSTKLKECDLPKYYLKVHSRSFEYSYGYINVKDVIDIKYSKGPFNHLFKDDYVYISYKNKIEIYNDELGYECCKNWDLCICGSDIIKIILAIEKYSKIDVSEVKEKVNDKIKWFREKYKDEYIKSFGNKTIDDIFEYYIEKGYVEI